MDDKLTSSLSSRPSPTQPFMQTLGIGSHHTASIPDPPPAAPARRPPTPMIVEDAGQAASPEFPFYVKICVVCGDASDKHINWIGIDGQEHLLVCLHCQAADKRSRSDLGNGKAWALRSGALPTPGRNGTTIAAT
ncbi:hypothetical protein PG985_004284 [Apiospora marii]|uniref:Uncharacterized protein n=1 Tax=Apiospora marii TaxID=335849 RepID=A0ABR1S8W0_9PEZI